MRFFGFTTNVVQERTRHDQDNMVERAVMQQHLDNTRSLLEFIRQEARLQTRLHERSHGGTPRSRY